MVVVTNGCQDKGENGTHFILVVFMSSSRFSGGKEDDRSKIDCHTQSCQFPADRFWNSSNHKVFEQKQQRKLSNRTSKLYISQVLPTSTQKNLVLLLSLLGRLSLTVLAFFGSKLA